MDLSPADVRDLAAEYEAQEPLAAVEEDHVKILPRTFASGEYGWRDAKWVVRWYYRRFLGDVPNAERRAGETAFEENDFDDVRAVIQDVTETGDVEFRLERLQTLQGVDLPVATAFLQFADPERYLVVGEREWGVLATLGDLPTAYPSPPTVEDYRAYLGVARDLAERWDCDAWTVYKVVWRLAKRSDENGLATP